MTVKLTHPDTKATVEARDQDAAEPYISQGWTEPKKAEGGDKPSAK